MLLTTCIVLVLTQQFLLTPCMAYDKDNVLVDYGDILKLSKSTEPDTVDLTMDLYSFPYIDNVSVSSHTSLMIDWLIASSEFDFLPYDNTLNFLLLIVLKK